MNDEQPAGTLIHTDFEPEQGKNAYFYKMGAKGPLARPLRMVINNKKYRTFEALLDDITDKVPGMIFGVRHIFDPASRRQVTCLADIEEGGQYYCIAKDGDPDKWAEPRLQARNALMKRAEVGTAQPKHLTIICPGQNDRRSMLLNPKTRQSFEQVMADVAALFSGIDVRKLYTVDGQAIVSLTALFNGPEVVMVGKIDRNTILAAQNQNPSSKKGAMEFRSRGRWKVWVTTSDYPAAGTTANVFLTAYGKAGVAGPLQLSSSDGLAFQCGNVDEFNVKFGPIGQLFKIRISHDNSGSSPSWFVEQVRIRDIDSGQEMTFPFRRWLSRTEDDLDIHREYAVAKDGRGELVFPIGRYVLDVHTGALPYSGTKANVFVTLNGENGDSGKRQLYNGQERNFVKGHIARFAMEVVSLGNLTRLNVTHDGEGPGRGWFLEKIVVKELFGLFRQWIFNCNHWLDESKEDGKTERDLLPGDEKQSVAPADVQELEMWKFNLRNLLIFYSVATTKAICFRTGNIVDCLGEETDRLSDKTAFEVVHARGQYRAFANCNQRGALIAQKYGVLTVQPPNTTKKDFVFSTSYCEFEPAIDSEDRRATFENARTSGNHWCISPTGLPADCKKAIGRGPLKEFYVYCKGIFRDDGVIAFIAANNMVIKLENGGKRLVAVSAAVLTTSCHFRVVKIAEGNLRLFESVEVPNKYLQLKNGKFDCLGNGDRSSTFRVNRVRQKACFLFQSMAAPETYLAVTSEGEVKPVVDPGSASVIFFPEVIQFGTPKAVLRKRPKTAEAPQPPEKPAAPVSKKPVPKPTPVSVAPSAPPSPPPIPTPSPEPTTPLPLLIHHPRADNKPRLIEGDWFMWITTEDALVNGNVGITLYGATDNSGTIMLTGQGTGVFGRGARDQFFISWKPQGQLYKIRLELQPISPVQPATWKVGDVQLIYGANSETFRFSFNRLLQLDDDDGDLMRELPAIRPSAPVPPVHKYCVDVETGNVDDASTQANIYFQIFGQLGDTGKRLLYRSKKTTIKWQPGQVDQFIIEAVELGTLTKCFIQVDSMEKGAGWFLSKIRVRETETSTKEFVFPCNRWFDAGRDDGKTERYLYSYH